MTDENKRNNALRNIRKGLDDLLKENSGRRPSNFQKMRNFTDDLLVLLDNELTVAGYGKSPIYQPVTKIPMEDEAREDILAVTKKNTATTVLRKDTEARKQRHIERSRPTAGRRITVDPKTGRVTSVMVDMTEVVEEVVEESIEGMAAIAVAAVESRRDESEHMFTEEAETPETEETEINDTSVPETEEDAEADTNAPETEEDAEVSDTNEEDAGTEETEPED